MRRGVGPGALLLLAFALLAAGYALAVPPGEAPDEPAHLFYVDTIVRAHALPARPVAFDGDNYEFFQPPLDYGVSALWVGLVHGSPLGLRFTPDPAFSFRHRGSRMFLPGAVPAAPEAVRALLELRLARLAWGLAMAWFIYLTALYFAAGDAVRAALAAAPLILAPQVLFVAATVNGDAALAALAAAAIYCLARCAGDREPAPRFAIAAGIAAALALLAKASGLVLLPPLSLAALHLVRRRQLRPAAWLAGTYGLGLAAAAALAVHRFGSVVTPIPAGRPSVRQVFLSPHWAASLWVSFWAKFGWLNTPLPWACYLLFLPATLLILAGFLRPPTGFSPARRPALAVLRAAALANLAAALVYMAAVDWQVQGRYLFPSLAALAGLAAAGLGHLPAGALAPERRQRVVLAVSLGALIAVAAGGVLLIRAVFR
jgi:4-amino-4-deoxy-L-arabinose transferase-like glycosyltransferase